MAYKFSLGKYVHSGSITAEEGLTVSSGDVALPAGVINNSELQHSGVTVTAGDGLSGGGLVNLGSSVTVDVATAGVVAIKADKVALSASIAGAGLSASVDGDGAVTALAVDLSELNAAGVDSGTDALVYVDAADGVTKKSSITSLVTLIAGSGLGGSGTSELSVNASGALAVYADNVILTSSVVGTGLSAVTGNLAGGVTSLSVKYGPGAGNAVQGNTAFTASAGDGLSGSFSGELGSAINFTFDVKPAGAVAIKADKVAISASIAGSGLSAAVDGDGAVTALAVDLNELSLASIDSGSDAFVYIDSADGLTKKSSLTALAQFMAGDGLGDKGDGVLGVQRAGAIAILSDKVALSSSVAGVGITAVTGGEPGAVASLQVKYGPGAGNAVQGNTTFTASAGAGLTGDFSGELGSGVNFTFAVASANGGIVANANDIELKLSSSNALKIDSAGLDLKSTIAGARTFSNDVTINGNLYVSGTQTYVDSTNIMLQDPIMMLGSASLGAAVDGDRGIIMSIAGATDPVFFWDQSESQFALASTNTPHSGLEVAVESYADLKVKSLVATQGMQESIQTLSANGAVTASICLLNGASAGFTATLPDASLWTGKMVKVKKSEGTENAIVVAASGSQTLDGVASISLESPYAAVAFVSNGSNWFIF